MNIYNWSSLFIFNIYASAYLLKFVIPILTLIASVVICRHEQNSDNLSHHMHPFSAEVELGDALPSCFSSHSINSLMVLLFFALLRLLGGGTLLLKMGPECSAKMLSSVPKCKKAEVPYSENTCDIYVCYIRSVQTSALSSKVMNHYILNNVVF